MYNYIVTTDTIPKEFGDCPIRRNRISCYINLRWLLTSKQTGIFISSIGDEMKNSSFISAGNVLSAYAYLNIERKKEFFLHSFTYSCSSDRCNDINTFKRILYSLIITDQFNDIKNRLIPVEPFDGHWCLMFSNKTSIDTCSEKIPVDPTDCKQCSTRYLQDSEGNRICAGCFTDRFLLPSITRLIEFNITGRTTNDRSFIECQSKNCNGVETMQLIREKSTIRFNYDQFLNTTR
ncbi:unnamed protein product [Adineta ricciae]|uniref:Uncharacterized protein n=1 Tax=Adineta ricciae TaxID=249248 RepID=A0A816CMF1_ADIRI|nr:unnamed protein product [Adineta ricciae]